MFKTWWRRFLCKKFGHKAGVFAVPLLLGLTAKYPQFILASFTHDLEKITLAEDKTSSDVLDLFGEKNTNG